MTEQRLTEQLRLVFTFVGEDDSSTTTRGDAESVVAKREPERPIGGSACKLFVTFRLRMEFQRNQHWAADAWCAVASGSRTLNVLPVPGPALDAVSDPPCDCTISRAIARPNPRPPCLPSRQSSV